MKRLNNKGFTLLELIIVITIIGLIGGSLTSLFVFGLDVFGMANRDYQIQSDMRMALEQTNKMVRYAKALFAVPGVEYMDDEWNYIGMNEDRTQIINYSWNPSTETHDATPMVGPYDGVTFNIGFYKEDNMEKDNSINVYFEMFHGDGTVKRFNIQTGYEALNSLQVVDYGTALMPANALAYRSDEFHYENYLLKVNITLILDVSGSMNWALNGSTSNVALQNRRIYILKDKTRGLIESFSQNTNDDVEINIALVPFSTSANSVRVFRNVKTEKATLLNYVDSICMSGSTLNCVGGTNTGDGMRRAYYRLMDKTQDQIDDTSESRDVKIKNYNIFLTDGETTYRSVYQFQSGTREEEVCIRWTWFWCSQYGTQTVPVYSTAYYSGDGDISESTSPTTSTPFVAGNGNSTSTEDNEYVALIGAMLGGALPVNNYNENEQLFVTNYIIGFTAGVSDAAINFIAASTNTPTARIYRAADGDELALSFSEIQLSITNDTWHYLGPSLVE
ncbi:MAG: VWA domain-containing protein [Erysipelothrix sp.]|nr:VWA domain-containing protein [Erysipelothrix sp.]